MTQHKWLSSLARRLKTFLETNSGLPYHMPTTKWRGWWHASSEIWEACGTHTVSAEHAWQRKVTVILYTQASRDQLAVSVALIDKAKRKAVPPTLSAEAITVYS